MLSEANLMPGDFRLLEVDNPLVVPVNVSLRFLITSVDVLHA
jgi:cytochrome c oxidase subunit 2